MIEVPRVKENFIAFQMKMSKEFLGYMRELRSQYGDIFYNKLFGYTSYFICQPKHVERIFTNPDIYIKHPILTNLEPFMGKNALLTTNNLPQWHKDREISKKLFEADSFFPQYTKTITAKCKIMLDEWEQKIGNQNIELPIGYELDNLALNNIQSTLFHNIELGNDQMIQHIPEIFNCAAIPPFVKWLWMFPTKSKRKYYEEVKFVDETIDKVIGNRLASGKQYDDLIGTLLNAYQVKDNKSPDFKDIGYLAMSFTIVGSTTTTSILRWILVNLSLYPEYEKNIAAELDTVCSGRIPTYEDFAKLKHLHAFVNEVLRMYPPLIFLFRQTVIEDDLVGYRIPPNVAVLVHQTLVQRHPDYWEDPDAFKPERFLAKRYGQDFQYAYIPFGAGKRGCLGKNFAFLELCLITAMIVQRFRVSLPVDFQVKPIYFGSFFVRPNIETMYVQSKK